MLVSVLADVLHHARRRVRHLEKEREDVEAARLAERLRQQSIALASLSEVLRISETADVLIAQGLSGLGASAGGVALVEAGEDALVIRRSVGYATDRPRVVPLDQGPAEEALRTRRVVAVESMAEFARRYPGLADLRSRAGTREALLMAPLLLQDRLLGVLFVGFAAPRAFTAEDVALFETLAAHGAPALERAQRYEAERAARLEAEASDARHRLLAEVSVLLAADPNPEAALPDLARRLVPELADACLIHVIEPDGDRRCAAAAHAVREREPVLTALCEATQRGGRCRTARARARRRRARAHRGDRGLAPLRLARGARAPGDAGRDRRRQRALALAWAVPGSADAALVRQRPAAGIAGSPDSRSRWPTASRWPWTAPACWRRRSASTA